jgi:hypothetical protein
MTRQLRTTGSIIWLFLSMALTGYALKGSKGAGIPDPVWLTTEDLIRTYAGAITVMVGTVTNVVSRQASTVEGQTIISDVTIAVVETLKGRAVKSIRSEVEGGSLVIDGKPITLEVSYVTVPKVGDKAVFFLDGNNRPVKMHQRSILQLDANDRVRGTGKTLEDIRREVQK